MRRYYETDTDSIQLPRNTKRNRLIERYVPLSTEIQTPRRRRAGGKVVFIAPFYLYYPIIPSCMLSQIYPNWELHLIHDGPCPPQIYAQLEGLVKSDARIVYTELPVRTGVWGHKIRQAYLEMIGKGEIDCDYVVITNGDNYHCPAYCAMLVPPLSNPNAMASYHDLLPHNYMAYNILPHDFKLGHIDVCQLMVKKEAACSVGWKDLSHSSDWPYMDGIRKKYGSKSLIKVGGCLSMHN